MSTPSCFGCNEEGRLLNGAVLFVFRFMGSGSVNRWAASEPTSRLTVHPVDCSALPDRPGEPFFPPASTVHRHRCQSVYSSVGASVGVPVSAAVAIPLRGLPATAGQGVPFGCSGEPAVHLRSGRGVGEAFAAPRLCLRKGFRKPDN